MPDNEQTGATSDDATELFDKVALVGLGLLGGSLAKALRAEGICDEIVGVVRRADTLNEAIHSRVLDSGRVDDLRVCADADLIILCTPVDHIERTLEAVAAVAKPGAIITDVGSIKAGIVAKGEAATKHRSCYFVGSHPMAGAEKAGLGASRAELFRGTSCFVTVTEQTHRPSLARVVALWRALDTRLVMCRPERHDELVGLVSHLPHLIAVALTNAVAATGEDHNLISAVTGSGFMGMTRVAKGDKSVWRPILEENAAAVSTAAKGLAEEWLRLTELLSTGQWDALQQELEHAKKYREFLDKR